MSGATAHPEIVNLALQVRDGQEQGHDYVDHGTRVDPASFDDKANTVDVVWSTGARVMRYSWVRDEVYEEELEISRAAIDMTRFESGAISVLDTHQRYTLNSVLGTAVKGWVEGKEARATLKLSQRDDLAGLVSDIKGGVIRNISVGYSVQKYEVTRAHERTDGGKYPIYRAVRWTPSEISFVPVPADPQSGTRSHDTRAPAPCEITWAHAPSQRGNTAMSGTTTPAADPTNNSAAASSDPTPAAPVAAGAPAARSAADIETEQRNRSVEIVELCTKHRMPQRAVEFIRSAKTVADVGLAIAHELAARDEQSGGHRNAGTIETVADEHETRMAGMLEAVTNRVDPKAKLTDSGRQYRGMSLLEMGRELLESRGINTRGMPRLTLAQRMLHLRIDPTADQHTRSGGMLSTSDFSSLLANVGNKRLRNAYEENPGTYTRWARRAPNAPDFKSISIAQLSAMPDLLQVNEHGEFKYGTLTDGGTSYALLTYGRIVSLTRQSVVNDDLRAFDRMVSGFGGSAARLENRTVYAQITSNPNMSDAVALFHATHGNLDNGAGSALQLSSLNTLRKNMRLQKGLAGEELNLVPSGIIVPAALEHTAYQLTSASYVPATQATISEFRAGGRTALDPVVEPILDANSATAWYGFASNSQVDTVEYCWLEGAEGPVIESEMGFEVDGISLKCREDFAAKVIDHRGLAKANGA